MTNQEQDPKQQQGGGQQEGGGQQYDAPNQQVVGGAHPSEEGTGGQGGQPRERSEREQGQREGVPTQGRIVEQGEREQGQREQGQRDPDREAEQAKNLEDMNKDELLAEAQRRGAQVDPSMTKAEIREAIE